LSRSAGADPSPVIVRAPEGRVSKDDRPGPSPFETVATRPPQGDGLLGSSAGVGISRNLPP
jgi:hypothetical protein